MNVLTGALDTFVVTGLVPADPVSRPAEVGEFSTNLALKGLAPVLTVPGDRTVRPNVSGECRFASPLPQTTSEYDNWFGFWEIKDIASDWGALGRPDVYHANTGVSLQVHVPDNLDPDGGQLLLAEGLHRVDWQADTRLSPFWDIALPTYLMIPNQSNEVRYASAAAEKAAHASAKAASKLKRKLAEAAYNIGKAAGLQVAEYLADGLWDDSVTTVSNRAIQSFTVWDVHTPKISTTAADLTLEARDFGGLAFSRAYEQLLGTLSYSDDCGRPVRVSHDAPLLLPVGQTTAVHWTVSDAGPYPVDIPPTATVVQHITVADTQAPLLVPPAGFARYSATPIDLTAGGFDLGMALISDLSDPRPTLTRDAPATLEPDHRYTITYTATDASGNSTRAPQDDPGKYTQIVTIKSPGSNTAPTAQANDGAATITSQPVILTLTGQDGDLLDGRYDPLEFRIVQRPAHGEFVAPLYPFFIEDFRAKPSEPPGSETAATLACPANPNDGKELEGKLGSLVTPSDRKDYVTKCYCIPRRQIPHSFIYAPRYIHVTDEDVYYVTDRYWSCSNDPDAVLVNRIAKFYQGEWQAEVEGDGGFDGVFQMDEQNNLWWVTTSGAGSSKELQLQGRDRNLEVLEGSLNNHAYRSGSVSSSTGLFLDAASLVNAHVDSAQGVVYVNDQHHVFMFDAEHPGVFLGALKGGEVFLNQNDGVSGFSSGGFWMQTDSEGNLYQLTASRIFKFGPPKMVNGVKVPGDYIGWLGRCTGNLSDPATGVPYSYCDVEHQRSKGFQCTDLTCARDGITGDGQGQFNQAMHLDLDPNDILYVVDYENYRIQRFATDGTFAGEAISTGEGVSVDGNFVLGNIGRPRSISVNSREFHVLERSASGIDNDYFLHIFKTLPFHDITPNSAQVDYVSDYNFQGQDSFSFVVDDGIDISNGATVTVEVARAYRPPRNLAAACFADEGFTAPKACEAEEDGELYLRLTADDLDGFQGFGGLDLLSYRIESQPGHGSLSPIDAQASYADYRYRPAADYFGADRFEFQVSDGHDSAAQAAAVELKVLPVRDPTVISASASIKVARGFLTPFHFTFSDVDADSFPQPLAYSVGWGDGSFANREGNWDGVGVADGNGQPRNPQVDTTAGNGYLVAAHIYDAPAEGITWCMASDGDGEASCATSAAVEVVEATRLSVRRTEEQEVQPNQTFPFSVTVTNEKPSTWDGLRASGVQAALAFPSGVKVVGLDPRCSRGKTVLCPIGDLAQGASAQLDFRLRIGTASARKNYSYDVAAEITDAGPQPGGSTIATLVIQLSDRDHDGTLDAFDAYADDARYATKRDQRLATAPPKTPFKGQAVTAIACGPGYSLALTDRGWLYGTGYHQPGNLGDHAAPTSRFRKRWGRVLKQVAGIAAGGGHAIVLAADGTVKAAGDNRFGQLGLSKLRVRNPAWKASTGDLPAAGLVAAGAWASYALSLPHPQTGSTDLWVTGASELGDRVSDKEPERWFSPEWKQTLASVKAFTPYADGAMALKDDGSLWRIEYAPLGVATRQWEQAVEAGVDITDMDSDGNNVYVVSSAGELYNLYDRDGDGISEGGMTPDNLMATDIVAARRSDLGLFLLDAGGNLGIWIDRQRVVDPDTGAVSITEAHLEILLDSVQSFCSAAAVRFRDGSTESGHVLAIRQDGSLWAAGSNTTGQFGNGTTSGTASLHDWVQLAQ